MTTATPNPARSPIGCLSLVFMVVALLFLLSQAELPATEDDDS